MAFFMPQMANFIIKSALNYSEIEDSQYDISDSVKAFNRSFYQKEGDQDE